MNSLYEQQETCKLLQIIPTSRIMNCVYYDDTTNNLFRCPVVCLGLLQVKDNYETYNKVIAIDYFNGDNGFSTDIFEDPTTQSNFIGIEFDNVQEDWDYNIEWYNKTKNKQREVS